MCAILRFKKIKERENILLNEYFLEPEEIDIVQFNFDGEGSAICRIGGKLEKIPKSRINRIILGVERIRLEDFLTSIFDADFQSEDSPRRFGELQFRLPALQAYGKNDISNLAKKTLKEVHAMDTGIFTYFEEVEIPCGA